MDIIYAYTRYPFNETTQSGWVRDARSPCGFSDYLPGIGNTFSRSLKKTPSRDDRETSRSSLDSSSALGSPNRASHKLPPGTGPGTSGRPAADQDQERGLTDRSAAGFGTDAAAATGGSLASTHQGAMTGLGTSTCLVRGVSS